MIGVIIFGVAPYFREFHGLTPDSDGSTAVQTHTNHYQVAVGTRSSCERHETFTDQFLASGTHVQTTFATAHRLSTVRDAGQMLVFDDNEAVERGTHDELLSQEGLYTNLWRVQVGEVGSVSTEFVQQVTER